MTGYGKAVCETDNKKITVEIKTLNSKQTDINTRISGFFKEKDIEIRSLLSKELIRGKIDFTLKLLKFQVILTLINKIIEMIY